MMPFTAFRHWVRMTCVRRALSLIAVSATVAVLGVGLAAEEKPPVVARPANPLANLFTSLLGGAESSPKVATSTEPATHARQTEFLVKGHDDKGWLQAFAVDSTGRLIAAVGRRQSNGIGAIEKATFTSEVQILSADGKPLDHWSLDFEPQRIAVGSKDEVFVAGSGKIARFDKTGKLLAQVDSPHLAGLLGDPEALKESARQQREQMANTYGEVIKSVEQQKSLLVKRIAALEEDAKKAEERKAEVEAKKPNAAEDETDKPQESARPRLQPARPVDRTSPQLTALKRQLQQNDAQIKAYRQILEQQQKRSDEEIIQEIKQRLQKINAISVSGEDVFLTTGIAKGYGYSVWRTDLDLKEAKQVVTNLSGCCGQMDVQAIGGELFIAENTRHRVGRYDRDGKSLATFGSRERESNAACFGGCCNPMNVCLGPNGTVLTSESEGFVKCFQADGTYVGLIGKAKVAGGCKNVSIATSPDGDRVYFYDLEKSRVVVMARENPTDEAKPKKTASKD